MVTLTPDGWPVPADTDPLANVADWITDLALAMSPRAVGVSRAAAFSIPNAAFTDVPMTAEDTDVHNQAALAGGVYTVTLSEAGLYRVTGQLGMTGAAGGNARGAQILAGANPIASVLVPNSGAPNCTINLSGIVEVGLATVIKLQAYQNSGAALNTISGGGAHAWLSAYRIAAAY